MSQMDIQLWSSTAAAQDDSDWTTPVGMLPLATAADTSSAVVPSLTHTTPESKSTQQQPLAPPQAAAAPARLMRAMTCENCMATGGIFVFELFEWRLVDGRVESGKSWGAMREDV